MKKFLVFLMAFMLGFCMISPCFAEGISEPKKPIDETIDPRTFWNGSGDTDISETMTQKELELMSTCPIGDVNFDGKVTAADARLALRNSVGLSVDIVIDLGTYNGWSTDFRSFFYLFADINHDGYATAADARHILRIAVGLESMTQPPLSVEGYEEIMAGRK